MDNLVLSVFELNQYVADKLSSDPLLEEVWIKGEISDVTMRHNTVYFALKDDEALIDCMIFDCHEQSFCKLEDIYEGRSILVRGDVSIYRKNGKYRLLVRELQLAGMGDLLAQFKALKEKLEQQGIFLAEHKKALPKYPNTIGIVTSKSGAAIHDIKTVISRRSPHVQLKLYPVRVQGSDAPLEIERAIEYFNQQGGVDVLIVGRGGGSAEDLFAFNDERVVMAVYHSNIPVISAVGHESDVTLCDLAADFRAPTPSAAAEIAVPVAEDVRVDIEKIVYRIAERIKSLYEQRRMALDYARSLLHKEKILLRTTALHQKAQSFVHNADAKVRMLYQQRSAQYEMSLQTIESLNPFYIFSKGYSIALKNNVVLNSIRKVDVGEEFTLVLADGELIASVTQTKANPVERNN